MKRLISIMFILSNAMILFAQIHPRNVAATPYNEINKGKIIRGECNQHLLDFVHQNASKKVGDGNCSTLIIEGIGEKYKNFWLNDCDTIVDSLIPHTVAWMKHDTINLSKVRPGDIICFNDVVFSYNTNDTIVGHVGIVMQVIGHVISYANQNDGDEGDTYVFNSNSRKGHQWNFKKSRVKFAMMDLNKKISGSVVVLRF